MWIVPWKANRVLWWLSSAWVLWQLLCDIHQLCYIQFTAAVYLSFVTVTVWHSSAMLHSVYSCSLPEFRDSYCVTFISYVTFSLQPQSTWVSWQLLRDTYQLRYTQFTATVWCWRHVLVIVWNYSSRRLMWPTYTTYWKSYKQVIVTQSRKKYKSLSLWEGQTWTDYIWREIINAWDCWANMHTKEWKHSIVKV